MKSLLQSIFILIIGTMNLLAQNENWDSYIATYEDGNPGSTTLRMDLIQEAPFQHLPNVLVTGLKYETSRDDGFPENETFKVLHKVGDELIKLISDATECILAGSFMYNGERLEYFYIENEEGLKEKIEKFYQYNYPDYQYYLNIKEDKNWEYYTEFLYPNDETLNYMADQSVIRNLIEAGDPLTKKRRVDHWLYFSTELNMKKCMEEVEKNGFMIQSAGLNDETELPYELQMWKVDNVDIESIYSNTSKLREIVKKYRGEYDGWETTVEKD